MNVNFKGQGIPDHPRPPEPEEEVKPRPFVIPTPKGERMVDHECPAKA